MGESPNSASGRLLVVEDHDLVRRMTVTMLERAHFEVVSAASGVEALRLLKEGIEPVDCALIDLAMPGVSGRELAKAIRREWPSRPIVMMSGYNEREAAAEMMGDLELDSFLQKPFTADALLTAVQGAMNEAGET